MSVTETDPTADVIDVHTHVVPRVIAALDADPRWPLLETDGQHGVVYVAGRQFRRVGASAWDLAARAGFADSLSVKSQVLSPMPELLCYWAEPDEARRHCDTLNDWLAAAVASHPAQFRALGVVPMQHPDLAIDMLTGLVERRLSGVEIGTSVGDVAVFDARFAPFWAEVERLDLAVFLHAFKPLAASWFTSSRAVNAVLFPTDVGVATSGLILSGLLSRHPSLRICASHAAGTLPLLLGRMQTMWQRDDGLRDAVPEGPRSVAGRLFYDFISFDARVLDLAEKTLGAEQMLAGSDYPFFGVVDSSDIDVRGLLQNPVNRAQLAANGRRFLAGR